MKSSLTLALSAALALGAVAPVFAQSGTATMSGTDCPVMGAEANGAVDPTGDAKAPGAAVDPCKPSAGTAGASGADSTGSTVGTTLGQGNRDNGTGNGDKSGNGNN